MQKYQSFDTFKYLLACCVLLGHGFIVLYPGAILQHIEAYAVDGFFLISGFFLAISCLRLSKKESNPYSALKASKNEYKNNASIVFSVLNITDAKNIPVISKRVQLKDIKDNDILDLDIGTILTPGEYKFVIQADKSETSLAISTIKTSSYKARYYINDIKVNERDIQCRLTY